MRHRDKVGDEFIEELFENPTATPKIFDENNPREDFDDDCEDYGEDFEEEDFDEAFDEE